MRRRLVGLLVLALVACSSSYRGASDESDAGTTAGALVGGDFELPGCSGWSASEATFEQDSSAHAGKGSCRVCGVDGQPVWFLSQSLPTGSAAGTYVVEAWLRSPANGQAATNLGIGLAALDAQGTYVNGQEGTLATLTDQWQKLTTSFTLGEGQTLEVKVLNRAIGGCFLVDDAVLTRVK